MSLCARGAVRRAQNRMTRDVLAHLRAISAQQSKIRGLRNKLAILREAAARHADALGEFRVVRATAAAYSQCLAECMRRCAPLSVGKANLNRLKLTDALLRIALSCHRSRPLALPGRTGSQPR